MLDSHEVGALVRVEQVDEGGIASVAVRLTFDGASVVTVAAVGEDDTVALRAGTDSRLRDAAWTDVTSQPPWVDVGGLRFCGVEP